MSQIPPHTIQSLLALLTILDEDSTKHPCWIDAVCNAREALPADTPAQLRDALARAESPQPGVVVNGIEYVPRAEIPELTDARLKSAVQELVAIQYFRQQHKAIAKSWNALNALAPELAQLADIDPGAAMARVNEED